MSLFRRRSAEPPATETEVQTPEPAAQTELTGEKNNFSDVEPLSLDFLRFISKLGADRGKFIRLGDEIYVSPGPMRSSESPRLTAQEMLEQVLEMPDVKERLLGTQAVQGATEKAIGPDGMTDAGKFDMFFDSADEQSADGTIGRFRVFGLSADFGAADVEGRNKTVELASEILGPQIVVQQVNNKIE